MLLSLRQQITNFAHKLQDELFPTVEAEAGELGEPAQRFIAILAMIPLRRFVPVSKGWNGRPSKDRHAIACAYVAKVVYNFPDTRDLLDRLQNDPQLRMICGWKPGEKIPHESTFSRAFAEFAEMELPQFVHEALIRDTQKDRLVGHIARDSTAIEVREPFPEAAVKAKQEKQKQTKKQKKQPGEKEKTRLQRQRKMTLTQMLEELPQNCDICAKKSSTGHPRYWRGYKLHLDVADGQIPISAVLTSASVHDSPVAIPLATMTAQRVTSLYDIMDSAYDAHEICCARAHTIARNAFAG